MPYELRFHAGVAINTTHVVICGGAGYYNDTLWMNFIDCFVYSEVTDLWIIAKEMTEWRFGHSMVVLHGVCFGVTLIYK
jgi:hypothetical protein